MIRRLGAGAVVAVALVGLGLSDRSSHADPHYVPTKTSVLIPPISTVRCEEDMPCWDCRTMGNRVCGEVKR